MSILVIIFLFCNIDLHLKEHPPVVAEPQDKHLGLAQVK
jgi:hypothetical protein